MGELSPTAAMSKASETTRFFMGVSVLAMQFVRCKCHRQPLALLKIKSPFPFLMQVYRALNNARQELGRAERQITPVDLAANEIYDMLRKRLFTQLPDKAQIDDIADNYQNSNQTQRESVAELADYLARKLETLRPEEASAT